MILRHELMTLSSTSASLVVIDDIDEVRYSVSFSVQNVDDEANVFLGDSTVTSESYGYLLEPKTSFSLEDVPRYHGLYAITDTNGSKIAVIRTSL